jgi:hypothetical protein
MYSNIANQAQCAHQTYKINKRQPLLTPAFDQQYIADFYSPPPPSTVGFIGCGWMGAGMIGKQRSPLRTLYRGRF